MCNPITLTVKEAKERGYTHAMKHNIDSGFFKLDDKRLTDHALTETHFVLVDKKGVPFSITKETIADIIDNYLCNQDEVFDEDGKLNELAAKVDYSRITRKLNKAFSDTKFYYPTEIRLIP